MSDALMLVLWSVANSIVSVLLLYRAIVTVKGRRQLQEDREEFRAYLKERKREIDECYATTQEHLAKAVGMLDRAAVTAATGERILGAAIGVSRRRSD